MSFAGETIWIIGASSGIGKALAQELSSLGAQLVLSSRRKEELEQLREQIEGHHQICPLDVSDRGQVYNAGMELKNSGTLDRVIFMAAVYEPANIKDMDLDFTRQLVDINLMGAFYVVHTILPIFEKQKHGQIAICASVAGYTGLPNGQPYSATKAALINFTQSLYAEAKEYIDVKIINPGFVRTPATDKNNFKMPMRIEPGEAARAIAKGLKKGAFEIHFPKRFTYLMKLLAIMPYWIKLYFTRRI